MKQLISLCVLGLAAWAGMVAAQETGGNAPEAGASENLVGDNITTPDWVDFSSLPDDIEKLRELDSEHRAIAREAARSCSDSRTGVASGDLHDNPCVLRRTAEGLNVAGNPQLKAFHYALPLRVRYNGLRTEVDWRQPVQKQIEKAKTGD